jgi:hypothetical protein
LNEFININDQSIPLGKRKQHFVKWLLSQGVPLEKSKLICGRKFYHEIQKAAWKEHEEIGRKWLAQNKCPGCHQDLGENLVSVYDRGLNGWECSRCN